MQKRLQIIFFLVLFSSILSSQTRLDKPEIYIGTSFGASGSIVIFKPAVAQKGLQGYNGGFVFRFIAEKNVGMQAELNFSQRGWSEADGLYSRSLNYMELPFLTHIFIGKNNRVFLNIGPKISYLISEKVIKNETQNIDIQHNTKIQNPFDYGLSAGLGFMFNIKGSVYQFESRANYSLSDVFSNDKRDYFDTSNNFNLSVNLAWMLQVK